ncbi:SNF2-related protein [Allomuricauda sp. ARW1Y1]|jgi:hypothetical protein|uniref:SNF2-related protein n=1 Tax=Allomuricauda sp. ARW1Y1 TaxID=2663843 RepID=UPI0015C71D4D|nr:SNF2-related protein [Muricauda sp. ARW1Y1]NYJ28228.1 hypothetical protein [Muricauda sp. ARW1Y1]
MKYSKKRYLDHLVRTLDALHAPETVQHLFINNLGFGNIYDILKKEEYRTVFMERLERYFGSEYAPTVLESLEKSSLNSYFTPVPIIKSLAAFLDGLEGFDPKTVLEPSAGNGLMIRELLKQFPSARYTAFEKEILTTRILEHNFKPKANVRIFGVPFENLAQTDADKAYDLVISNIPFGANKVFDTALSGHPLQAQLSKNIHSYFVYKSLSCLKPAGVSVLICTKNLMDKVQYAPIRKHLMETNNFLGGVRLPDSAFAQENTAVVTDILIFQNNQGVATTTEQQKTNALFSDTVEIDVGENSVQFSSYFSIYGEKVLGDMEEGGLYDRTDYTVKNAVGLEALQEAITQRLSGIHLAEKNEIIKKKPIEFTPKESAVPISQLQYQGILKTGNLVIREQRVAKILENGSLEILTIKPKEFDKISKILALRDTYLELLDTDRSKGQETLDSLNYQYDLFDFQYGKLHDKANYPFVTLDIQGQMLLALERPENGTFVKADVLINPWSGQAETPEKLSLEDAIYFSLNKYNGIDRDILAKMTGKPKESVIKDALERQLLFLNPEGNEVVLAPKFLFLSGTIYKKINFYRKNDFGPYQSYVDKNYIDKAVLALEEVKPPITPFEDLDIKLHEPWFPLEITQAFLYDTYQTLVNIAYNESTSKYMAKIESYEFQEVRKFYVRSENRSYYFTDILEGALNSTIPYISKGPKGNKKTDKAKMQEIRIKFELLYKDFHNYILGKPDLKRRLEFIFYKMYDAKVHPKYDGSYLKFEGLQQFTPYQSQQDTVAGIIINQGLLVNKEVGFGKTLDMALASFKLKELHLSNKTLIIGLRSTVVQLERELLNAFPNMKLLVAHDKVVSGLANRNAFFAKIAATECDVVLMSHDTFKFIPQSPEVIHYIISEELANLERDLSVIHEDKYSISKRVLKGLQQRRENLKATLDEVYFQMQQKQSEVINFDQMGFGHIMIDESHKFKNLMYTTRHNRVAGLNTNKGSQRSKNLLVAIRNLQMAKERDFQATFLSGTPISNSITEVYVLFKYLIPNRMREMNITSFDQWAQVFANKSYEFEPTVSGDYKVRERFRSFKKMKLLSSLYNEISIIVNGTTHQIDRPKMQLDVHTLKPTPAQLTYFERIKEFLQSGDSNLLYGGKEYTEEQKSALSLIALHHMRNASIDPRLLNQELDDPGQAKLRIIASEIHKTYTETNAFKGTQAVFSDLGVPKEHFNIYDELKRILVEEYAIRKEEVVFIHDFKTDKKRLECFKRVNEGVYRIIIGSTEKLGTGTNIQQRLVRIHHVDIPYRPTDIDQRNGRGIRKGNLGAKQHFGNKVIVSFYIVENCTDALMLNNVNIKKNFIEQLTNGTIQFNRLDMGPVNDEGSIDYKTLLAVAKNDPLYLEKEELGKQLEELKLERSIFKKNRLEAENNINFYENELLKTGKNIDNLQRDMPLWESVSDKKVYFSMVSGALKLDNRSETLTIGKTLQHRLESKRKKVGEHTIVSLLDAELRLRVADAEEHRLYVKTPNASYSYGSQKIVANPLSIAEYMHNALAKIPRTLRTQTELKDDYSKAIGANKKVLELEFDKSEQLEQMERRLEEINTSLEDKYDVEPEEKESNVKASTKEASCPQNISL